MGAEEKLEQPTEKMVGGKAKTRKTEEAKRVCAERVAERSAELLVNEDGESRVTGIVLGGLGPVRRLVE